MRLQTRLASCPSNINSAHSGAILLDAVKEIWVVSADWKLRALVRAELRERGFEAHGFESLESATAEWNSGRLPAVLVFDAGAPGGHTPAEAATHWVAHVPVVVVASAAGTDFQPLPGVTVLRRPIRIEEIVAAAVARVEARGGRG